MVKERRVINRSSRIVFAVVGAASLAALACGPAAAEPDIVLVPHHATYKLTLTRSKGDKSPAGASGIISYDFTGSSCEGYATTFRQVTEMQPAEGESRISDMRSATFEDGESKQFRFNTQTTYSGAPEDDINGKASKASDGTVAVDIEKPKPAQQALQNALFPTEHLLKVLANAREGKKLLSEPVYDGSETGKIIYDTLAVIGAPLTTPSSDKATLSDAMASMRRWPVSISYFEQGKNDAQPNYVLSFDLYENGVSRALTLDYGTFTLAGELVDLKLLPVVPCKH